MECVSGSESYVPRLRSSRMFRERSMLFWVVRTCGLAGRHQRFGETYCFCLHGEYVGIYLQSVLPHIPEKRQRHLHRCENLKSHTACGMYRNGSGHFSAIVGSSK
jgi:hypothetical protein